jgi:hypothetical protein
VADTGDDLEVGGRRGRLLAEIGRAALRPRTRESGCC